MKERTGLFSNRSLPWFQGTETCIVKLDTSFSQKIRLVFIGCFMTVLVFLGRKHRQLGHTVHAEIDRIPSCFQQVLVSRGQEISSVRHLISSRSIVFVVFRNRILVSRTKYRQTPDFTEDPSIHWMFRNESWFRGRSIVS
ncbi:hypothetical protein AVEN_105270-1 [Araneus ventricosus]|uniref:Uncharacterized protein n=1 Tax=Araneus ventricosus TaxID=182803 RepID=A0A4Y2WE07_ARAVE|nr:hypothetical protein AVEN_105270-1 [Araneus ventricosus]